MNQNSEQMRMLDPSHQGELVSRLVFPILGAERAALDWKIDEMRLKQALLKALCRLNRLTRPLNEPYWMTRMKHLYLFWLG